MIVRNEERFVERALDTARPLCDEMIVVDTGSTDRTVALAEGAGARVYHFTWIDDFSAARNAAADQCTGDWILILDGDDVIPPESQRKILELKHELLNDEHDVVEVTYDYIYDENGRCINSHSQVRLVRRASGLRYRHAVHENIAHDPARALVRHDIVIEHRYDPTAREDRMDRVGTMLEQAIRNGDRHVDTLRNYAFYLVSVKKWAEARDHLQRFREAAPNSNYEYSALDHLSFCESFLGNPQAALEYAQKALALDATRAEAYVRIAMLLQRAGQYQNAIPYLLEATKCPMRNLTYRVDVCYTFLPWDLLSQCYAGLGDYPRAIECVEKALTFNADTERLKKNLEAYKGKL